MTTGTIAEPLFRTVSGEGLHMRPCPHILGCEVFETTPEERPDLRICQWTQAELAGVGRTYYDTLRDAMRAFKTYSDTENKIEQTLAGVAHDQIWIPNSQSYIALGLAGLGVAWVGKTYVMPSRHELVELPGYAPGGGGGAEHAPKYGETCPRHFVTMSLEGVCDDCL